MNRFERLKMTLFDSTNANFKLEVEAQFTRGNRDTGFRDIVYTTDRYTGILNPNIYLTFAYRSDEVSPVYTSYPQLFRIREAFEKVKNWVADGSGFMTADGVLCVRGNCDTPVVVAGIGKNNNWISLKLVAAETDEDGVVKVTPCVAIELSSSNRLTSILSAEEFLTVYTIIRDLNLSTLQCMMSLGFLNVDRSNNGNYYSSPQPQMMNNGWGNPAPQNNYPQNPPMSGNYVGGGATTPGGYGNAPARPRYNNQSYRNTTTRQVPPPPSGTVTGRVPTASPNTMNNAVDASGWPNDPNPYPENNYNNTNNSALPPRGNGGSIMNMKAVDETPITEISYDDTSAIDEIFKE
jgi:hypothetical protein